MKAMIFAAGLGTRLYPLTKDKPKALVEVNGVTLLEILIKKLIKYNVKEIIINIHHYADLVKDFIAVNNSFGVNIVLSDESDLLLDTGGGLKKASWFFNNNEPFLLHNVDILSDINFTELFDFHAKNNALVTLCVKQRQSSRYLLFNDNDTLCGWENVKTSEKIITRDDDSLTQLAFSGIQVISPNIFKHITMSGVFSIIDLYLQLSKEHQIKAYKHDDNFMLDIGKKDALEKAINLKF